MKLSEELYELIANDKSISEIDRLVFSTIEDIRMKLGVVSYSKIEPQLKALLRLSYDCGEYMTYRRIETNKNISNENENKRRMPNENGT